VRPERQRPSSRIAPTAATLISVFIDPKPLFEEPKFFTSAEAPISSHEGFNPFFENPAGPPTAIDLGRLGETESRVTRHTTRRQPHLMYLLWSRHRSGYRCITLTLVRGTMATAADDLYRAQAIVTGQWSQNRNLSGFASAWRTFLIKVSARRACRDRRLAPTIEREDFVRAFRGYQRNQMSGTSDRDEQAPSIAIHLTVDFERRKSTTFSSTHLNRGIHDRPILAVLCRNGSILKSSWSQGECRPGRHNT